MTPERLKELVPTRESVQQKLAEMSLMDVDLDMEPTPELQAEIDVIKAEWGIE